MADLIDRQALVGSLKRTMKTTYPNLFPGLIEAIDFIKDFPAVDAVEVVRCKDCKHQGDDSWCEYVEDPDFYCKRGERRAENG